jgi:hypothetical protein
MHGRRPPYMVGWGLLNDQSKGAWIIAFRRFLSNSFPALFPGLQKPVFNQEQR